MLPLSKRFSTAARIAARQALISRDGERCALCQKTPPAVTLEIDHILPVHAVQDDTGRVYHALQNLRLLCVHCNRSRQYESTRRVYVGPSRPAVTDTRTHTHPGRTTLVPPRKPGHDVTRIAREEIDYSKAPAQMVANASYEPAFRTAVLALVDQWGEMPLGELRDAGAELVGCSVQTAGDYLAKMVSRVGALEILQGGHTGSLRIVRRRTAEGGENGQT